MFVNEQAWQVRQDSEYLADLAMKNFLEIYAQFKRLCPGKEFHVPENAVINLQSPVFPLGKWLASADVEYRRLYRSFWEKRISYCPKEEYEVTYRGRPLHGGLEAYCNDSFMVSICLDAAWETEHVTGTLFDLAQEREQSVEIRNVYRKEQLEKSPFREILEAEHTISIASYEELWKKKERLFPRLSFCPSVERDLEKLEISYLDQIVKKLMELEKYCENHGEERFTPELLTKTTKESPSTMAQYKAEHTFTDAAGELHTATWHMRFTGIPGRIFFLPEYRSGGILICYVGKKLPNVTYPT